MLLQIYEFDGSINADIPIMKEITLFVKNYKGFVNK
jgi:hypothetical protein